MEVKSSFNPLMCHALDSTSLQQGSDVQLDASVQPLTGTVMAIQANYYWVRLDPSNECSVTSEPVSLLCTRRARLKKIGQRVLVGDRVLVEEPDWSGGRGAIAQVMPRHNELDRPPIANCDQILLVFALAEPDLDPIQLSRFLVKSESTGLHVSLCLNKADLVSIADQELWCARLHQWGYEPVVISIEDCQGLHQLRNMLRDRITVVSGPSGVGKSSLINYLIPSIDLRTSAVSGKLGRGRHTTRHVELFELPNGGFLADTPGFNQPDLHARPIDLASYFPEAQLRLRQQSCQFADCLHRDEPNCAVRGDWERYDYYLKFLDEAIAYQESQDQSSDLESSTKSKIGSDGQLHSEPKLAPKTYRRPSRRQQRQQLQNLYHDLDHLIEDEDP